MNCSQCGGCCKHVALEIDTPEDKEDYGNILWYLLHENVIVFVDGKEWYIEFAAKCKKLGESNLCGFYEKRPQICREYDSESCVRNGEGEAHDIIFNNAEEFLKYLNEKGLEYQ